MKNLIRYLALILLDTALAVTGAWLLWLNAGTSVTDGPLAGTIVAMLATGALLVIRQITLHPAAHTAPLPIGTTRALRRREIVLSLYDILLIAALITTWLLTNSYLAGWIAAYASVLLMLSAALQLLIGVTTPRTRTTTPPTRSLLAQRLTSLETLRLITTLAAITGILITGTIHQWQPHIINPLVVMLFATISAAACTTYLIRRRTPHATPAPERAPGPLRTP